MIQPTIEHAREIKRLIACGIPLGLGSPEEGKMCIEHIVSYVFGQPKSDSPKCVGHSVRDFKIALNDKNWPSPQHRAKGLLRIGIAQLGSVDCDQQEFKLELQKLTIKFIVPIALRVIKLEKEAVICEQESNIENCLKAKNAAAAADAAADAAAAAAAYAAASAAASAAAAAAYAADDAAYAAAYAAASAAAADDDAARFKVLWISAELGTLALQRINSPGCQWLDELCPITEEFKDLIKDMPLLCKELGI